MVIFRSADGKPGYHQAETLDEAARFVERLRNEEQVTDARVFRMEEVPIEFRVYYRVEVAGATPAPEAPEPAEGAADAAAADVPADAAAPVEAEGDPALSGANGAAGGAGRFGLFSR